MKFGNELIMELDQLDQVSGGTYMEFRAFSDFMYDKKIVVSGRNIKHT